MPKMDMRNDMEPGDEIRDFVDRAISVMERQGELREELKDVFAEAKGRGYDAKLLRKIVAEEKRDRDDVQEELAMLDLYREALRNATVKAGGSIRDGDSAAALV